MGSLARAKQDRQIPAGCWRQPISRSLDADEHLKQVHFAEGKNENHWSNLEFHLETEFKAATSRSTMPAGRGR